VRIEERHRDAWLECGAGLHRDGQCPRMEKSGVMGRLRNLGYNCDVDSDDEIVTAAVKSYQKAVLKDANPTGNHADIQQTLDDRHSKP
jgi:hypothetical protein